MLIPTTIMAILAVILVIIGHQKGQGQHVQGLIAGARMTVEVLPMLVFAFLVAGMVQVLIPQQTIARWVGSESGLKGILIGTVAGGFAPGGPYVSLPIVAGLMKTGAGVGTLVAFLTGWSLWAVSRCPMEIGLLGWKFWLIRLSCVFIFPPIAGWIAHVLFSRIQLQ